MWPFKKKVQVASTAPIFFTNTLTGKKDLFAPLKPGVACMYSCGPTVYSRAHIGNMRSNILGDLVARVLTESGLHVRRVINITDVGHLVGDTENESEDKMALGAKRENVSPEEIAHRYTKLFLEDIRALNIETEPILFPRATEYIPEQIAMISTLMEKGYAYTADDGVYFDTQKLPDYGKLGGIAEVKLMGGARIKIEGGKRNFHDFALWRKAKPNDLQQWPSPWGAGNPGWHIECSAMIRSLLGTQIDVHTGGMDLIPTHHNNEIAQTEAACGTLLARYWIHGAFINIEGEKISKSLGNDITLTDITDRGFHPLALRYFFLQAHYRSPVSFSWEALAGANEALSRLWRRAREIAAEAKGKSTDSEASARMTALLRDDLATPAALAFLWEVLKDDELSASEQMSVLTKAEAVLGLSLLTPPTAARQLATVELPDEVQLLIAKRDEARIAKEYGVSDELRAELETRGYRVDDGPSGTIVTPTSR